MEFSDTQLVKLIQGGDSDSYAILVDRYQVQIYNLMYRFCGSGDQAADLTQDVFCRAFEKLDKYEESYSFFSWLYTMALNYARDWSRKHRLHARKAGLIEISQEQAVIQPHQEIEMRQETALLLEALERLPEDRRELVLLRYRHDCSIKEIARIFGLKESAVKMRLHRSLAELENILEGLQRGN